MIVNVTAALHDAIATWQVASTAKFVNPEQHDTLHLHLAKQGSADCWVKCVTSHTTKQTRE